MLYSIKDLEIFSGIMAHTIRIWEVRYKAFTPIRTDTNIRRYTDEDLKKILNIAILKRNGYRISKILKLDNQELKNKVFDLYTNTNDPNKYVDKLVAAMIDLDENKFGQAFSDSILYYTLEEAIVKVFFPFIERTGILWQTDYVTTVQKRYVTYLLRQKLIVAIDGQLPEENENSKTFALFLPDNKYNEIDLLLHLYLIKRKGHKAIYLGESVTLKELEKLTQITKIDYFLTTTIPATEDKQERYLNSLFKEIPKAQLILSSSLEMEDTENFPNMVLIRDVSMFRELLKGI